MLETQEKRLIINTDKYVGIPYAYGGRNRREGLDCLGLFHVIAEDNGIDLKEFNDAYLEKWYERSDGFKKARILTEAFDKATIPTNVMSLEYGDILLFRPQFKGDVHIGIYIGNNHFIHCRQGTGVIVTRLSDIYIKQLYRAGKLSWDEIQKAGLDPITQSVLWGLMTFATIVAGLLLKPNTNTPTAYGFSGAQTNSHSGVPVPIIYGRMVTGGTIINQYVYSQTTSQEYLNVMLALSEGIIYGINNLNNDIFINSSSVANWGSSSIVNLRQQLGTSAQTALTSADNNMDFDKQHTLYAVSAGGGNLDGQGGTSGTGIWDGTTGSTTNQVKYITQGSLAGGVDKISLHFTFPSGLYHTSSSGDTSTRDFTYQIDIFTGVNSSGNFINRVFTNQYTVSANTTAEYFITNAFDFTQPYTSGYSVYTGTGNGQFFTTTGQTKNFICDGGLLAYQGQQGVQVKLDQYSTWYTIDTVWSDTYATLTTDFTVDATTSAGSGNATFVNGSQVVQGDIATRFKEQISSGDAVKLNSDGTYYLVNYVAENNMLYLQTPFIGAVENQTGAYTIEKFPSGNYIGAWQIKTPFGSIGVGTGRGTYYIAVTRVSTSTNSFDNNQSAKNVWSFQWNFVDEMLDYAVSYNNTGTLAMAIKADVRLNGTLPNITAYVNGIRPPNVNGMVSNSGLTITDVVERRLTISTISRTSNVVTVTISGDKTSQIANNDYLTIAGASVSSQTSTVGSGTLTFVNGSNVVTESGGSSSLLSQVATGDRIKIDANGTWYTIQQTNYTSNAHKALLMSNFVIDSGNATLASSAWHIQTTSSTSNGSPDFDGEYQIANVTYHSGNDTTTFTYSQTGSDATGTITTIPSMTAYKNPQININSGSLFATADEGDYIQIIDGSGNRGHWWRVKRKISSQKVELFENISETFTYASSGMTVNWLPICGGTQLTNGTWNNSANCTLDFILNKRYGLGSYIDSSRIDITSFQTWYTYCNGTFNYTDPFGTVTAVSIGRVNGIIDTIQNPKDLLDALAQTGDGFLVWQDGYWRVVIDQQGSSSASFDDGTISIAPQNNPLSNIVEDSLNINFTAFEDIPTMIEAEIQDKDNSYIKEIVNIDLQSVWTGQTQKKTKRVNMWGTTDRATAIRRAQRILNYAKYSNLVCSFESTLQSIAVEAGDIVSLTHSEPGWVSKLFRVIKLDLSDDFRRQKCTLTEYDNNIYTALPIQLPQSYVTTLPDPQAVPENVLDLTMTEHPIESNIVVSYTIPTSLSAHYSNITNYTVTNGTGNATFTNGSVAVSFASANTTINVGDQIKLDANTTWYTVATVLDSKHVTLTATVSESTATSSFSIQKTTANYPDANWGYANMYVSTNGYNFHFYSKTDTGSVTIDNCVAGVTYYVKLYSYSRSGVVNNNPVTAQLTFQNVVNSSVVMPAKPTGLSIKNKPTASTWTDRDLQLTWHEASNIRGAGSVKAGYDGNGAGDSIDDYFYDYQVDFTDLTTGTKIISKHTQDPLFGLTLGDYTNALSANNISLIPPNLLINVYTRDIFNRLSTSANMVVIASSPAIPTGLILSGIYSTSGDQFTSTLNWTRNTDYITDHYTVTLFITFNSGTITLINAQDLPVNTNSYAVTYNNPYTGSVPPDTPIVHAWVNSVDIFGRVSGKSATITANVVTQA